jgi:uncharacterized membrane protein
MADELRLTEPRGQSAGAGVEWIGEGWKLFARAPLMWVIAMLVVFVLMVVVNFVPLIGTVASQIFQPVFAAGFVVACRSLETGGEFELEHLFAGFKRNLGNLVIVGIILLAGFIALFLVFAVFAGFGLVTAFMAGDAGNMLPALMASGTSIALGTLVMLALMVPLFMAYWFAPALVMMHDMAPVAAMKLSFRGCLRNIVPFIIWGFVMMILCVVAMIPFGLGLLVWVPLAITGTYVAYRRILTEDAVPASPAMAQAA